MRNVLPGGPRLRSLLAVLPLAPIPAAHGTRVSAAGFGDATAVTGLPPRGAPV